MMPTYIFVDREEYDSLKRAVENLRAKVNHEPKKEPPAQWPIWGALAVLALAFCLVRWGPKDPGFDLVVLVAANSVAQMFIDFFKGDWKPVFSAVARISPIALGVATYYFGLK